MLSAHASSAVAPPVPPLLLSPVQWNSSSPPPQIHGSAKIVAVFGLKVTKRVRLDAGKGAVPVWGSP